MGSDLRLDEEHGHPGLPSPVIAETLRTAVSLGSAESSLQALIGMMIETGPWTAGSICLLNPGGTLHTAAHLDIRARECDRLQAEFDEGPALDAMRHEQVQTSCDLAEESRWRRWSPAVGELGIHGTLVQRLFTSSTLGTVNLYSTHPSRVDDAAVRAAQVIGAHASVVVASIITGRHLRNAMLSRSVIGQAQGILMQRHGVTADRALELLRRQSQQTNIRLVVLAQQIADTAVGSGPGSD